MGKKARPLTLMLSVCASGQPVNAREGYWRCLCSAQVFSGGGLESQSGRPGRLRPCAHKHGARDRVGRRETANLKEVISVRK